MQLRATRLTAIASAVKRAIKAFSPAQLFGTGAQGVWYDPSDLTTLFQDSAGTTPVTAVEQPVGLMLDKSQGLVLGPTLVTNGDFSDGSVGWSIAYGSFDFSNGAADSVGGGGLFQSTSAITVGKTYEVRFTVSRFVSGTVRMLFNSNASGGSTPSVSSAGTFVFRVLCVAATTQIFFQVGGTSPSAAIDNISVKELPGNHAFQATSASRPVLSARYNLLTKTEEFNDAVWTKTNATVSANSAIGPNGQMTADKVIVNNGAISGNCSQIITFVSGQSYRFLTVAKANDGFGTCALTVEANAAINFDLITNTSAITAQLNGWTVSSPLIEDLGNGWKQCSATFTAGTSITANTRFAEVRHTGDGVKGMLFNGSDLRPTNQGVNLPAYQRVNTATDYNTVGFLPFLKFDGIDDSLSTNSINFTSTDKMSVFAGVRKLSDAAVGMIAELSTDFSAANNGSFALYATNSATYKAASRGSIFKEATSTTFASPITNVLTELTSISGDQLDLRINGALNAQNAGDQGTGNYGNYPLYIGRRNNATLPFNGQLYSMIIVGKAVTAGELSSTETYVNSKTGAYT